MDDKQIKGETVKAFWNMLKNSKPPKGILIIAVLLSIVETGSGLIVPLLTKDLVDQLASSSLELSIILVLALAFVLQAVTSGFAYYLMTYIGEKVVSSIRERLWAHILKLPIPFFDTFESGETMSRVTQDTNTVKTLITQHMISFVTGLISIFATIIILCIIDWKMTVFMLLAIPISLAVFIPLGRKIFTISKLMQDEMASFSGNLGRVLSEIRLVKAYHAEKIELEKGKKGISHLFEFGLKEAKIQAIISPFMTFIMMLMLIMLIGYGGVRVSSGELSAGSLVAIIIYMFQIIIPFSTMATAFTAFQKAMGATERIKEILSIEVENPSNKQIVSNPSQPIVFNKVSFSYNKDIILKNISLAIPPGKTTAFVGPSGSGKTTLFSLLERFYQIDHGEVFLGDNNIVDFDLESWRSEIGYVSQESPIMSGSIMENITYGIMRDVSIEEVEQAATQANAMEFISRLPQGLKTEVGERGIKLSGGQRQRIAIARALIRNPKILLLDEATSNLDSSSEKLVQKALENLMIGRTTLVIAHRLATVVEADQIVVLENGEITGIGTHKQLFESHSLYKELAEQQLQTA
ncbi:ABC transporter ATP-binding protein [Metabacillus litoralis]|uniref:ABC transporter ATP-binding protein n=1 Tax=Metabacillus litoralis TaxID=152268 RepID=A0A5C6W1Z2_9BACI|nr:ABC transporter ATP-binding protein [Metabacillus litoralis]TXC91873.1 ABC transporter ATP-binding protein [Metabacillus litoralis]